MKGKYWKRPFDDEYMDDEARAKLGMEMYQDLVKVNEEDGMTFANKTAMWLAYERQLESERPEGERLFNDKLATFFAQPYGKDASDAFACHTSSIIFDPNKEVPELRTEGFALYHAARTKLISVHIEKWLKNHPQCQVVNLGAGMDTRPFWDECLKDSNLYIEVDTREVQDYKQTVFAKIKSKGELPSSFCQRKVVSMDFTKESTKSLPDYGIQFDKPTCWILEGLIMYLKKDDIDSMLTELSILSPAGSYVILNFANGIASRGENFRGDEYCGELMTDYGWKHNETVFFGDSEFSFDRYPKGKPSNTTLGFSFYSC
mmetsp:Transcript_11657/g.17119  ORF Transcript_11657/g.17119 Transcript_11657/m.17119 type:complete len:317 (-) Transcript_11657:335-1285(-)|eukprot:CAMPEP_0194215474 /NCGR_PEP_ID=MMETSP0156-20130528/17308_1 /TAXON_ID=33649 /ORGANISM="Thalassionema nitzschioides, Strain L26-B" /LENGTH=316 /DNA_ID=CAMNT_0038943993 /DNA_START=44 /DNA_END=994 /DNA_ORIENTATION=-